MKTIWTCLVLLALWFIPLPVYAQAEPAEEGITAGFDMEQQLEALGKEELMQEVPEDARALLEDAGIGELSVESLMQLSPQEFFRTLWELLLQQVNKPVRTLGVIVAVALLCALLGGCKPSAADNGITTLFSTVAVLCILTSVILPILDCIMETSAAIKDAALFMTTFIPIFAASLTAAGQPVTGATYNLFLFSTCQIVAQVVAQTLIPLMGMYLALCVVGALVPEMRIASTAAAVKTAVTWTLGLTVTLFVGLLSLQTLVSGSADNLSARAAKFMLGNFVPVVGGALSEAFGAAQGCLRLIKTTVGVYGILVALVIFLPVLLQTVLWYLVTGAAGIVGDVLGVDKVSTVLKSCSTVLGILLAVILCFALLVIVSTTVVMVTGMGG